MSHPIRVLNLHPAYDPFETTLIIISQHYKIPYHAHTQFGVPRWPEGRLGLRPPRLNSASHLLCSGPPPSIHIVQYTYVPATRSVEENSRMNVPHNFVKQINLPLPVILVTV